MIVKHAEVYGADGKFHMGDVGIRDGVFIKADEADGAVYDGAGCYAVPGLIDLHFHGAMGYDVCDATAEAYKEIARYEASVGVTGICPATLTLPVEVLEEVLKLGAAYAREHGERESVSGKDETISADLVGFNMEGPFISHKKKGAQNEKYIIPCDEEVFRRFYTASEGLLKFVGLAPEENPGFADFIRAVKGMAKVSLAHTNADYDTAMRAFCAGASHVVHLYDAMTPFTHREPGILGAAADSEGVTAELICDGIHVHPAAVRMAFKLLGKERIVFISDSLRCTGMPDGIYKLGGQSTQKDGKYCRLCDSGNIAGSVSNLYDCMKNAVQTMDIPLEDAIYCATASPAKCLGIYDRYGSIKSGKVGDLLLIDKKDLSLKAVFKRGRCVSDFT